MGLLLGIGNHISKNTLQGSKLNPLPPENAIRFEGTNELIHFENDETEQYIIFETI